MQFEKKKYTFRGMDGFAGFRHGKEYEIEVAVSDLDDEKPAEMVVINPVSRAFGYHSKEEFNVMWQRK